MDLEWQWYGPPSDAAPVLVFLHEGLGSASLWRDFPQRLAAETGCGALVYSRAGYGSSPPAPLPRPIRYMHDEAVVLDDVLRHHGVRDAILIGHSDGASIALIYAGSARREHLRALILEAPHVFAEESGLRSTEAIKRTYEATDLRQRLSRHHADPDNAFRGWNDVWLHPDFREWNIEEFLPSIDIPVLLIQGADDEYGTWEHIERIERNVRGRVESLLVPDGGHSPHRAAPEIVLGTMRAFIRTLFPAP